LLSTLSVEDRNLILMADLEGRSIEEIASLTGWGNSKIKMRLLRTREDLRQLMEKLERK
jgi:DNA-directed RNA polymerase specialized sigma24 family protein